MANGQGQTLYEVIETEITKSSSLNTQVVPFKLNPRHLNQIVDSFVKINDLPHGSLKYNTLNYQLEGDNTSHQVRLADLNYSRDKANNFIDQFKNNPLLAIQEVQKDAEPYLKALSLIDAIKETPNAIPTAYDREHLNQPLNHYAIHDRGEGKQSLVYELEDKNDNLVYTAHIQGVDLSDEDRDRYFEAVQENDVDTIKQYTSQIIEVEQQYELEIE